MLEAQLTEAIMATKEQKKELVDKVTQLVDTKFGGDWDKAFKSYAEHSGSGSLIDRDELLVMLEDAGIGNWLTRSSWADGIIEELDSSHDKQISWDEFQTALRKP